MYVTSQCWSSQAIGIPFEYNQAIELLFLYWNRPNLSIALAEVNPHRNNVSVLLRNGKSPAGVQRLYQVRRHRKVARLAFLSTFWSEVSQIIRDRRQEKSFFPKKYPRILGQSIKAGPLQRTIMELSCSLAIGVAEMLRLRFWVLELWCGSRDNQRRAKNGNSLPPATVRALVASLDRGLRHYLEILEPG